MIYSWVSEPH